MSTTKYGQLLELAKQHTIEHHCRTHPYENGDKLVEIVSNFQPSSILEIGTGMGYSSALMALALPSSKIVSIERNPEHIVTAEQLFKSEGISDRIKIINGIAEEVLPVLDDVFDCVFFDGFGIHYEFLPQYQRLLKPGGILILANNNLNSKTSDRFFEELGNHKHWEILEKFCDTTLAKRI